MSVVEGSNMVPLTPLTCKKVQAMVMKDKTSEKDKTSDLSIIADVYTIGFVKVVEAERSSHSFRFRCVDNRSRSDVSNEYYVAYPLTAADVYEYFQFVCESLNLESAIMPVGDAVVDWSYIQSVSEKFDSAFNILYHPSERLLSVKAAADAFFVEKHSGHICLMIADGQHRLFVLGASLYGIKLFGNLDCIGGTVGNFVDIMSRLATVRVIDFDRRFQLTESISVAYSKQISNQWNVSSEISVGNHAFAIVPVLMGAIESKGDEYYAKYVEQRNSFSVQASVLNDVSDIELKGYYIPRDQYMFEIGGYASVKNRRKCLYSAMVVIIDRNVSYMCDYCV